MEKEMTQQEALVWIADVFEDNVENIGPETSRDELATWDSLAALKLLAAFDQDLDIQLEDEEIQQLHFIKDILAILSRFGVLQ